MPLAILDKLELAYGHWPLMDGASLVIDKGERIGLIGRNGAGKSSLLKVVAGEIRPDAGEVWRKPGLHLAFVAQEPSFMSGHTVFEAVSEGSGPARGLLAAYHTAAHQAASGEADALAELARLSHELDMHDVWRLNSRVEETLARFDLAADAPVATLSGGNKKRVALARALVSDPELLLLDEPTNHLDFTAIEWLENLLAVFAGALLFVTHDRAFLDRVANRIIELDRGQLRQYQGNFSDYQRKKAEQLEVEAAQNRKFDKFWKQEEVWIRKGVEARRTRNEGRVRRLEALRGERAERRERLGQVGFALDAGGRSGQLIAEFEHVSHGYSGKTLISDFSTRILRGDKLGLIGPNGAGKTTLIKLILGDLSPDAGRIKHGTRQEVAYFDQFRNQLDDDATLIDTISPGSDTVEIGGQRKHVIGYLEEFLFPAERARAKVSALSGGERNRLLLARLFARPANILVLDEPTNDLDIDTLELLEQLLQDYQGTVILVSHDRAFLDNVVTQSIVFAGEGRLLELPGGYSDWLAWRARQDAGKAAPVSGSTKSGRRDACATGEGASAKAKKSGLSYKEQKELDALPKQIAALEAEQADLARQLSDPAVYADHARATTLSARSVEIDEALLVLLARWEELEKKM
ncbi:MAG: ABC transporter ATP-binding protein [Hydrogenophilales bacterium CG_4_9_14_3_um_filter_63_34]|nr:MAG: ABC transporter ATP-binding protein [Hydrogenophilales bacterium CG_4_10_14_3_um_filter_63_21]PJB07642.1 MAG: ABC transporter ATP-binding protein [Hydrogenophilales bacterium CG_4_9_14_3_um_filter_63_34]